MLLCRRETLLGDPAMVVRNPLLASTQSGPTEVVHRFYLSQNYPNPFNPSTQIRYQISESGRVTLTVFDLLGREVRTLVDEQKQPGTYTVTFDGSGLASGVYFYRLQAGSFTTTRKLVLLR